MNLGADSVKIVSLFIFYNLPFLAHKRLNIGCIVSCHVVLCHVMLYRVMSRRIVSCHVVLCHGMLYRVISHRMSCCIELCCVISAVKTTSFLHRLLILLANNPAKQIGPEVDTNDC